MLAKRDFLLPGKGDFGNVRIQWVGFWCGCVLSGVLLSLRTKHKENYWYSGFVFSLSLGLLAFSIDPHPVGGYQEAVIGYQLIARFLSALSYRLCPYFIMLAGLAVAGITPRPLWLNGLIASPVILGFAGDLLYPADGFLHIYLDYSPKFWVLVLWSVIYGLSANGLIVYAAWKEWDAKIKFQKKWIALATLPSLYVGYHTYLVPVRGSHSFTHITAGFAAFVLLVFIVFACRYGILGLRITIERDARDSMFQAVNTGSAMLDHAIRNKVQLIDMVIANLREEVKTERAEQLFTMAEYSTRHLMEMITRIQRKTQRLYLVKEPHRLTELLDQAVEMVIAKEGGGRIRFDKNYGFHEFVWCDALHMVECFENLLTNAMEAIDGEGQVKLSVTRKKKYAVVEIGDNGCGIPRDCLGRVIEPFYSSKPIGKTNFGLGLTYCYNVVKSHQGKFMIKSIPGQGTTVTIMLPLKECGLGVGV